MSERSPKPYGGSWRTTQDRGPTSTRRATRGVHVVYYVLLAPDLVKIGTSSNMLERARHHGLPGKDAIMAIEWGGRDLEAQRHEEFAHLRHGRTERFTLAPDLAAHIESLRAAIGV